MKTSLRQFLMCFALWLSASLANAAVLNFDDLAFLSNVPAGYGSNLEPNISVSYRVFNVANNSTVYPYVSVWDTSYGDLTNVIYQVSGSSSYAAEVTFSPASTHRVLLDQIDMAGWPNSDRLLSFLRVWNQDYSSLLYSQQNVTVQGDSVGPRHSTFAINVSHPGPVHLQWGSDWNIGVDNIVFRSSPVGFNPVPEPTSLLVFAGLACLSVLRRKP